MINKVVQGWINYYTQNAEEARLLEANYSISSKQYVENGIHMKVLSKGNDVYNFPTWQYCKYKDIFDSRIIINSTAKFYISISYQKDLLSIDTRIFTPSK